MRPRLLWVFLLCILLALTILLVNHEDGWIGRLSTQDFASLSLYLIWGGALVAAIAVMFRNQLSKALEAALFWILLMGLLLVGYAYRTDLKVVGDRVMSELLPGRGFVNGRTVEIARGRNGDFSVFATINGANVSLVLDTGASAVVLTQAAAKAAGLPLEVLNYNTPIDTANGRTRAASVTLDRLAVGGLVERSVPALVAQPGTLRTNLLGMSFLNRLESWEVRGDSLVLRGYP